MSVGLQPVRADGSSSSIPIRSAKTHIAIVLAYATVFLWVFWPFAHQATNAFQSGGDAGSFIWGFWWIRESFEHLAYPFSTTEIFSPVGTPLGFHTLMPLLGAVSIPLQWLMGPVLAFNALVASALILAGYGMFLLCRDLGQSLRASYVAGLAYGFFPPLVDRLAIEHLNLAFTVWLPLSLLALRISLRESDRGPRSSLWLGLALAGAFYTDFTLTILSGLLVVSYVTAWLWLRRSAWAESLAFVARRLRFGVLTFGILAAPYAAVIVRTLLTGEGPEGQGLGGAREYSADMFSFLLPSPRHRILGAGTRASYEQLHGLPLDGTAYLGVTIVALAVVGAIAFRRRPVVVWACFIVATGVILALGPVLHIGGRVMTPAAVTAPDADGSMSLVMPFTWMQSLPLLSGLRSPVRMLTLAGIGLGVLAGFGVDRLTRSLRTPYGVFLIAGLTGLIGFESLAGYMVMTSREIPAVYDIIAQDESDGVVVNVPLGFRSGIGNVGTQEGPPMVWATFHGHPIATGFGTRTSVWRLEALRAEPLYHDLLILQGFEVDGTVNPATGQASAMDLRAEWVAVNGSFPSVESYLTQIGYSEVGQDLGVTLFRHTALASDP